MDTVTDDLGFEPLPDQDEFGFEPVDLSAPQEPGGIPAPIMSPEEAKAKGIPYLGEPSLLERAAELIPEPLTAGLEAYGRSMLPVVYRKFESLVGVPEEQQAARAEENPLAVALGSVGGVVGGLAITGGAGQALLGARTATALAPGAALATRVGQATRAIPLGEISTVAPVAGTLAKTALGTFAGAGEAGVLSGLVEFDEAKLKNRPMKTDAVLESMVTGGKIGGILAGVPAAAQAWAKSTKRGRKYVDSLGDSAARRVLTKFGVTAPQIEQIEKQIGRERTMGILTEAADSGMVNFFRSAEYNLAKNDDVLRDAGSAIGQFVKEGDARLVGEAAEELAPDINKILERVSDEVIFPLSKKSEPTAQAVSNSLTQFANRYKNGMTIGDLSQMRQEISKEIYNLRGTADPLRNRHVQELRNVRNILTDEIGNSLERVGIKREAWRVPQRKYEVASRLEQIVDDAVVRGLQKQDPNAIDSLARAAASTVGAMKAGPVGLAAGPALGVGKRYWSNLTAWAPTATRRLLGAGAPKQAIDDLNKFSEQAAKALEARIPPPALEGTDAARLEQLRMHNALLEAMESIKAAPQNIYNPDVVKGLQSVIDDYGWAIRSPSETAKLFERTEKALSDLSRVGGVGPVRAMPIRSAKGQAEFAQDPAVEIARRLRDEFRASLAQPELFGQAFRDAAEKRIVASVSSMTDPARVAALDSLEELAKNMQTRVDTGADKLMGYAGAVSRQKEAIAERPRRAFIEISYKEAERERQQAEQMQRELEAQNINFEPEPVEK